ncbi:hypothetical protein QUF64_08310 [Anaerolineales bacterium HSG6]|nr:hypothetical protein [Anaerolineales bacterium HSG6]
MNREDILKLNVIPDGKAAWLSYDRYQELKTLFEAVNAPLSDKDIVDTQYFQLHHFLINIAKLHVPLNECTIHFNAFSLIRRGYHIEEITANEYGQLLLMMDGVQEAHSDDMALYEFGGHRDLYNYLTKRMGLSVQQGRGPVWHRAKALINNHTELHGADFALQTNIS